MENSFKLTLRQNNELIMTSVFNADCFSPKTLSNIEVRHVLPKLLRSLNKASSNRKLSFDYSVYNFIDHYTKSSSFLPKKDTKLSDLETRTLEIKMKSDNTENSEDEVKVVHGVELMLGFYINDKTISERTNYVDRYNNQFRFSNELYEVMKNIEETLVKEIKKADIINIYNENKEFYNV